MALDITRFNAEIGKIARGVDFHQFKQKCRGKVIIYSRSFAASSKEPNPTVNNLIQATEAARLLCISNQNMVQIPTFFTTNSSRSHQRPHSPVPLE
jgi:hypothetical protein